MNILSFRNDDVLQISLFTKSQKEALKEKSMFEWFVLSDESFKKYNYPYTLAVLAEGIDECPEWVEYIKKHINRYKIELHGYSHLKYKQMSEEDGYNDLKKAKEKIEETFGQKITTWYVPFGRSNIPEWGDRVCEKLGIKMDRPTMKCLPYYWDKEPKRTYVNYHYWNRHQVLQTNNILTLCEK